MGPQCFTRYLKNASPLSPGDLGAVGDQPDLLFVEFFHQHCPAANWVQVAHAQPSQLPFKGPLVAEQGEGTVLRDGDFQIGRLQLHEILPEETIGDIGQLVGDGAEAAERETQLVGVHLAELEYRLDIVGVGAV